MLSLARWKLSTHRARQTIASGISVVLASHPKGVAITFRMAASESGRASVAKRIMLITRITQIVAAIVIFAILGKTTDWLIEIATAPLLRWQDAFGRQSGAA